MDQQNKYTFNYDWRTVIKGFWMKYPCPEISFVKWNKVVDLVINPDQTISVKRISMTQKFKFMWGLGLEVVDIDFKNETLEMQTRMICKSKLFPDFMGLELVKYKALALNQTLYEKMFADENNFVMKYASQFNTSFQKGIKVVEEKCMEFVQRKQYA